MNTIDYPSLIGKFFLSGFLEDTGVLFFIVNQDLQVMQYNEQAVSDETPHGLGDLIRCSNAISTEKGCSHTPNCAACRIRIAMQRAFQTQEKQIVEACFLLEKNRALDVEAQIIPFSQNDEPLIAVLLRDVTVKKREIMMQRVFFHDMLNLTGTIQGYIDIMQADPQSNCLSELKEISRCVIDELNSQRELVYAQKGILSPVKSNINLKDFLQEFYSELSPITEGHGQQLVLKNLSEDLTLNTDANLVHRVLLNMVKNAYEASQSGETIEIIALKLFGEIQLSVHNPAVIPTDFRPNIFRLGNSTKGSGHGIGTYSMKLFGENYLNGKVTFRSTQDEGTTFCLTLPM